MLDEDLHGKMGTDEYNEDVKSTSGQGEFDEFPMCPSIVSTLTFS